MSDSEEHLSKPLNPKHDSPSVVACVPSAGASNSQGEPITALQSALILQISGAIAQPGSLREMLDLCCDSLVRNLDAAFARIWTLKSGDEVLELQASVGMYTHLNGDHSRIPVGAFKIGRIAQSRRPHLTNQVQTDLEVSDHVWAIREGMVAFAGHPLTIEDRVLGVMAVFSRRKFSDDTLRMLAVIASLIAHGINRQWLDEDRRFQQVKTEAALKAAERSNEALQRFAAIASHDLQEPVRQVAAFSAMLAKRYQDRLDAEGQQYMDFILDGAKRMGRLIQGLLAYSQIEAMATTPMETADTERALTEAINNLALAAQEAGALITHDPLPSLRGNQQQLAQLFLNLINNALKYRSAAPPRIHISATRSSQEWTFSVSDNGTGIPPDQRTKIFGVFIRLHGREIAGVGLGLAFCTKIVALHGGHIWADGHPDAEKGSVFRFTLPA